MFHIYGLTRDEVEHVLDSFPIIRKNEERDNGETAPSAQSWPVLIVVWNTAVRLRRRSNDDGRSSLTRFPWAWSVQHGRVT
jgi:hypothetical protein